MKNIAIDGTLHYVVTVKQKEIMDISNEYDLDNWEPLEMCLMQSVSEHIHYI